LQIELFHSTENVNRIEFKNWQRYLAYALAYVLTVVCVYFMLPANSEMDQYYEVGKPWTYDTKIAPMDFPIYKTEERMQAERDSLQSLLVPFMDMDTSHSSDAIRIVEALQNSGENRKAYELLASNLRYVYDQGIISIDDKNWMQKMALDGIMIIYPDNTAKECLLEEVLTPREACSAVEQALISSRISPETVKAIKVSKYISSNLIVNEDKTEMARRNLTNSVMPTSGMVQEGEKIVDKGEVVTEDIDLMLQSLKRVSREDKDTRITSFWTVFGDIILIMGVYVLLWLYLMFFRPKIFRSARESLFLVFSSILMIATLSICVRFFQFSEYLVPFAILPLVVRVFFDSRTALYIHWVTVLVSSLFVSNPAEFIIIQSLVGMVAISSLKDVTSRSQLVRSASIILGVYILAYLALRFSVGTKFEDINFWMIGVFFINSVCILLTFGFIYLVEKIFGFLSDITLLELSNVSSQLFRDFATKCPGTCQHVMQVSNLAESVARAVGANPMLAKAGAMYHDIGKMSNPMCYTENQAGGVNPTASLDHRQGAQLIISHVTEGVKLAKKHNLPFQIIEFIVMHHGTSVTRFFYNSYANEHQGEQVPVEWFKYPGPIPRTKETVIVMMCDSIEAASRSLKEYTEESISKLVEGIVSSQMNDGQYDDAPITMRDITTAKRVIKEELLNIYHSRISYPELHQTDKTPFELAKEININLPRRFTKR